LAVAALIACSEDESASGTQSPGGGNGGAAGAAGQGGNGGFIATGGGGSGGGGPPPFPTTCAEALDSETSVGCSFYPLVLPGASNALFIAANVGLADATVTLSTASSVVETQTIAPGATYRFSANVPVPPLTGVHPSGYYIESDQPLQVYSIQPPSISATNDAGLVLPAQVLGTRHRAVAYNDQFNAGVSQYVAIVATDDDTSVTFTLAQASSFVEAGGGVGPLDKDLGPESLTQVLDRFEVLVLAAHNRAGMAGPFINDLSASLIESDKPVAVYSGNDVTYAPAGDNCCADLVSDAVPPTTVYGTRYAGVKFLPLGHEVDLWRFIGDHDDTEVTLSGDESLSFMLQAGEIRDVLSAGVFSVNATEPIGLVHFMTSGSSTMLPMGLQPYDCAASIQSPGDPAIAFVYPIGNWLQRYVFEAGPINPGGGTWCHDHITVVAESSAWASITLDGMPLPAPTPVGGSTLSYAYAPVPDGLHEVLAPPDVPVEVYVYGYSGHGSYVMPAGMGLTELNPIPPPM
jgi:hypothetical protein